MSRIAFAIQGFTKVWPPTDDRVWFNGFIPQGTGDLGGFNESTDFAFRFINNVRSVAVAYDYFSDAFGPTVHYTGSGIAVLNKGIVSELDLITGPFNWPGGEPAYIFSSHDGGIACVFESYNGLNSFHFRADFGGFGISSVEPIGGSPSPITVNVFGHHPTMYADPGVTTSGSFSMLPDSYWPYANSEGVPIWDSITGAELITPPPQGF